MSFKAEIRVRRVQKEILTVAQLQVPHVDSSWNERVCRQLPRVWKDVQRQRIFEQPLENSQVS